MPASDQIQAVATQVEIPSEAAHIRLVCIRWDRWYPEGVGRRPVGTGTQAERAAAPLGSAGAKPERAAAPIGTAGAKPERAAAPVIVVVIVLIEAVFVDQIRTAGSV